MNKTMSYEEFLWRVRDNITDEDGHSPVIPVLKMLQVRWRSEVIYYLFTSESARFNEIKFNLHGITSTMLSSTLRDLMQLGLVQKHDFGERPLHVEYSLTEMGNDLLPMYYEIMNWGFAYANSLPKKSEK
ncbi:MAG: helix-turn-helix transcriptional regulator [Erysipelotrichaceae bacterium]|nr:helix-turn-helix transcriptional regulator [Erysipelotrichaceae bacterium]